MIKRTDWTTWTMVGAFIGCLGTGPALRAEDPPMDDAGLFDEPAGADAGLEDIPDGQSVSVGNAGQIDLHVKDLEISRVLQLLSIQSQRNIVASRNVAGSISADLYGVEFYEALDAILQPNGFGYREQGNFVYVYTASELKEIEESERQLTYRVVRLNYLTADDASAFATPLLSSAGSISATGAPPGGITPSAGDAGSNSYSHMETLVVRDYAEVVDEVVNLIKELDVRPKQVLVEATILQATLDEANALGVDFNILAEYSMGSFETPLNVVDTIMNPDSISGDAETVFGAIGEGEAIQSTVGGALAGESGLKIGILGSEFSVFIRALDRVTDTTVVANPKLLVLNRQRADLLVGGRLGYLSTTATDTATTQTVEFLDIGTQLSVRPFVGEDDFVRLELRPSISDGSTAVADGVVIPNETTQEITTNIMVRSGQAVVLGGLFKEDTTVSRSQWPFLGDIPIAGAAFKGHDDQTQRSEVIFLIKPTVVKDEALYAAGERGEDSVEHTRLGIRHGLLPWSRSKLIAGHMRNAIDHYHEGDYDMSLWCTNLALSLDPKMPEARRLKAELTGENLDDWPGSSVFKDAVEQIINNRLNGSKHWSSSSQTPPSAPFPSAATESSNTPAPTADLDPSASDFWSDQDALESALDSGEPRQANQDPGNRPVESSSIENVGMGTEPDAPASEAVNAIVIKKNKDRAAAAATPKSSKATQTQAQAQAQAPQAQAQQPTVEMQPLKVVNEQYEVIPETPITDIESIEVTSEDLEKQVATDAAADNADGDDPDDVDSSQAADAPQEDGAAESTAEVDSDSF